MMGGENKGIAEEKRHVQVLDIYREYSEREGK
jgi:hypothetical protein